jgi:hypothetical protein
MARKAMMQEIFRKSIVLLDLFVMVCEGLLYPGPFVAEGSNY